MPKINVYLPDDLAEAVKDAGVPVSAVCQRSLEQAVRRVADVRAAIAGLPDTEQALGQLTQFTARARGALALAVDQATTQGAASVDTSHLLDGILAEGTNLAVRVLRVADVDTDRLAAELGPAAPAEPPADGAAEGGRRFSRPAIAAMQSAVTEAMSLDHNYIGCEHLLLGLAAEGEGVAGALLRDRGADHRTLRRAVVAALAGYVHLRAQAQQPASGAAAADLVADVVRRHLAPVTERLDALERRLGATDPTAAGGGPR